MRYSFAQSIKKVNKNNVSLEWDVNNENQIPINEDNVIDETSVWCHKFNFWDGSAMTSVRGADFAGTRGL